MESERSNSIAKKYFIAQAQLDLGMSEATNIMQKRVDRGRMEPKKWPRF